ncbi:hypothetical protein ACO0QE_002400 [Hanseniaspora vineae]
MSAPSQFKQSSRKGKKAWRKNIDITDVEKGLEKAKDLEITHGTTDINELADAKLFQIDDQGDEELQKKLVKRNQIKKHLKSREILDAIATNSKVQPLGRHPNSHKHENGKVSGKKVQGVSSKKLKKLLELSGKSLSTKDRAAAHLENHGIVRKSETKDLWGQDDTLVSANPTYLNKITKEQKDKLSLPEELFKQSSSSWSTSTVQPKSMQIAPLQVRELESLPNAGKSYNPDTESWQQLIDTEYSLEQKKELRRVEIEQYRAKIQHLMETVDDNEEEESSDEEEEEEEEDKQEQIEKEIEDNQVKRLSINPVVQNKKKTKYQRNKQKRHQDKINLQKEIKALKEKVKALENLDEVEQSIETKNAAHITAVGKDITKKIQKRQKLGTKHNIMEEALEVKFKDELTGSLRQLRPEGNLLYDNVRKLQSSGKIEARIPTRKGRKHKPRVTEKWTYKDFK